MGKPVIAKTLELGHLKLIFLLFIQSICICFALDAAGELPYDKPVLSPNKQLTAQWTLSANPDATHSNSTDKTNCLSISNIQTGQISTIPAIGPLYFLQWTGDSKTIVTVEHRAGGSAACVYNYDGILWENTEIVSPEKFARHTDVVKIIPNFDNITVTYKTSSIKNLHYSDILYHIYNFNVSGRTGEILRTISERKIDLNTFDRLPSLSHRALSRESERGQ